MKIAIFHHTLGPGTAIGTILERLVIRLAEKGSCVTIYGCKLSRNIEKNRRVHLIKILSIRRPLFLLFLIYHVFSSVCFLFNNLRGITYDVIIGIESNFLFSDICYAHSCHTAYLKKEWRTVRATGLLRILRWLNHKLRAMAEPLVFRRASLVVVPSRGLKEEIEREFPFVREKVRVISNFIDWERMQPPSEFDRDSFRKSLGYRPNDVVGVFVALGNFEHKGLPLALQGVERLPLIRLLVVGGKEYEITTWQNRVESVWLKERVTFVGLQQDIRPYLWASDFFVFPSAKEIFPLAVLEGAAAGLPLVVTCLYGVEEFMQDGEMGYVVERNPDSLATALEKFMSIPRSRRLEMGTKARDAVKKYSLVAFTQAWLKALHSLKKGQ